MAWDRSLWSGPRERAQWLTPSGFPYGPTAPLCPAPRSHLITPSSTDDEKILVEPACGAALAAVYSHVIQKLQGEGKLRAPLSSIVVIVCGGSNISLGQLQALKEQLGMKNGLPK